MDQLLRFAGQFHRLRPAIRLQPLQPLLVQSEYALAAERSGDLARRSTAQFFGSGHFDLRLRILVFDTFQPTAEPFVRGQATRLVVSVTVVSFKHAQLFLCADRRIDFRSFGKSLSRAGDGKEIANGGKQEIGFGSKRIQIVGIIKSILQPEGKGLLCVLRTNRLEHQTPRSDIAGGGGNLDAIIQRSDIGGMSATTRIPRQPDSRGINFRSREQIIERAHSVPDGIAGQMVSNQQALRADHRVLSGRVAHFRFPQVLVIDLQPFTLTDRIPGQCDEAFRSKRTQHLLPGRIGLAARLMPQREQDRRVGWMPCCGQIKIRSYVEVRLTLEDHFLDSVPRALQDSNHTRVQWRSFGKASEIVQHPFPEISSSSAHIFDGDQPLDLALSLREHLQADVVQVRRQHPADILELL